MNVSQLSRFRAIAASPQSIAEGCCSSYWRIHNLIQLERQSIAMHINPIAKGNRLHSDDGTSGLKWAYFRGVHARIVEAWLEINGWERRECLRDYDCTGEFFARSPWVRQVGDRVLVTQSWGYDI